MVYINEVFFLKFVRKLLNFELFYGIMPCRFVETPI
jgi:hypothetical protein